jgi:peptidoglycan hydrolase-like protein with peptidoglycan-binding domain
LQATAKLPHNWIDGILGLQTAPYMPDIPYAKNSTAVKPYSASQSLISALYTDSQIAEFTELLKIALYVNGFGDGNISSVFDDSTKQAIQQFQEFYRLPVTGKADKVTWMALCLSCGNPNRAALAADCATPLTAAKAQTLYDNGYRYIGRYLNGTYSLGQGQGTASKALTKPEAEIIFQTGLNFFPIFQEGGTEVSYFTPDMGDILITPMTWLSCRWLWSAVCKAASVTKQELGEYRAEIIHEINPQRKLHAWMVSNSEKPQTFKRLFAVYQLYMIPNIICLSFSVFGCFTNAFDKLLDYAMIVLAILPFSFALIGVLYKRFWNKKDAI